MAEIGVPEEGSLSGDEAARLHAERKAAEEKSRETLDAKAVAQEAPKPVEPKRVEVEATVIEAPLPEVAPEHVMIVLKVLGKPITKRLEVDDLTDEEIVEGGHALAPLATEALRYLVRHPSFSWLGNVVGVSLSPLGMAVAQAGAWGAKVALPRAGLLPQEAAEG